ncbi:hypothetical protein [Bradyrhizobium betae]|uniref:Uncharacterized protein n=1 Tax=Bradyrhizobium betae TaxID=244734 RepID=A0A5P6NZW5_9BRAD|nr:hypothetical protein [Bradyrhizobium betae]MCS3725357.1 hypothetical protein [Bradyrhizobium betae]QFI71334.1 hypothetical protein F8237_02465 [Bradyrhizobium betae]
MCSRSLSQRRSNAAIVSIRRVLETSNGGWCVPSQDDVCQPRRTDRPDPPEQKLARDEIDAARRQLKIHLEKLIAIVRERYIEVDIDKTNLVFAKAYASILESVRKDE